VNPAEAAKDTGRGHIARAQIPKIFLAPAGFLDLLGGETTAGIGMDQNTSQHLSGKNIAARLSLKPERWPSDCAHRVEDLSQSISLRKASADITPARIGTQVHSPKPGSVMQQSRDGPATTTSEKMAPLNALEGHPRPSWLEDPGPRSNLINSNTYQQIGMR
jgi:hypothetical protein